MRRRIICFVLAMMTLLVIMPSFATTTATATNGSCKKTFVTSDTLYNDGNGWDSLHFLPSKEIVYTNTGSYSTPVVDEHVYGYARPQGTDGTLYGTQFAIYYTHVTDYIPNSSGSSASACKFKIYNALYNNYNYSSSTMTLEGVMYGVY